MPKDVIDILIEKRDKEVKYFKDYLFWAQKIKEAAEQLLGDVKVFVFGSILRKGEVPNDIDMLIISSKLTNSEEKGRIRSGIWRSTGISSPFEIHLITPEEYNDWYSHFIKDEKIEI